MKDVSKRSAAFRGGARIVRIHSGDSAGEGKPSPNEFDLVSNSGYNRSTDIRGEILYG